MEIVYHIPIMEKLCSAITESGLSGRKIDEFILNEKEYEELCEHDDYKLSCSRDDFEYYGVPITKEQ